MYIIISTIDSKLKCNELTIQLQKIKAMSSLHGIILLGVMATVGRRTTSGFNLVGKNKHTQC